MFQRLRESWQEPLLVSVTLAFVALGCGGGGRGAGSAGPGSARSGAGSVTSSVASPASSTLTEPLYVLFEVHGDPSNSPGPTDPYLEAEVASIKARFGAKPAGSGRHVGFTPFGPLLAPHNMSEADLESHVNQALDVAEKTGLPVFFHLDDHLFWWRRTDLNTDPEVVEWSSFPAPGATTGTPITTSWLNWGQWVRFPAGPPCFDSKRYRDADAKRLGHLSKPIVDRLARWKSTGQEYLFAGVGVGNETQVLDMSMLLLGPTPPSGLDITVTPPVPVTMQRDEMVAGGFHSLTLRGYTEASIQQLATSKGTTVQSVIAEILGEVAGDYAEFRCKTLADAGLPRERIYTHFTSPGRTKAMKNIPSPPPWKGNGNEAPPYAASVNDHGRPGFTLTRSEIDLDEITAEIAKARAGTAVADQGWAAVECYLTGAQPDPNNPATLLAQTQAEYEEYLGGLFGHGARLVNVYAWGWGGKSFDSVPDAPGVMDAIEAWLAGKSLPATWTKD